MGQDRAGQSRSGQGRAVPAGMETEGSPLPMLMSPFPASAPTALVSLPAMVASPGEWGKAVCAAIRSAALPIELMRPRTVDLRRGRGG